MMRRYVQISSATSVWLRWMPFWYGLFYVTLAVVTGIALIDGSDMSMVLLLSLSLALWYGTFVKVSPLIWQKHPLPTVGYLALGWMLWIGLVELDPVSLFLLMGLYPQAFVILRAPRNFVAGVTLGALSVW